MYKDSKENYDTLYECGVSFDIDETPESVFGTASNLLGDGSFAIYYSQKKEGEECYETHYGLIDEERKININMSKIPSPNKVEEYKRIMRGLSSSLTDDIINAII